MTASDVTAETIYEAYTDNEIAADRNYKNKVWAVSGTLQSISKDIFNHSYIIFRAGNINSAVQCVFDGANQDDAIAKLKTGQRATTKGLCKGKTLGTVIFGDCTVQ
jgi:hypothetical protein